MPIRKISAGDLKALLAEPKEYAFLDVREHGQYGEGHPFLSVNAPYSVIETCAPLLVPCFETLCILMDAGDGVADLVHARMVAMGYTNLVVLNGGAPAWAEAGYTLFKGVNVISKSFGELVEHFCETPSISAEDLQEMQQHNMPVMILDGRSPKEFQKMSLPGAMSCPNAELAYRLPELLSDQNTPVVINCAGRTRSIIGAQSLRYLGLKNPVLALRNGTQGWRLSGFDLCHGEVPQALPVLSADAEQLANSRAEKLIVQFGLKKVTPVQLQTMRDNKLRTTFLFDVRTEEEYLKAHWAGARHAPGGQLVQATDEFLGTRQAQVVLSDDLGLRAAGTAIWLKGMGHDVFVLEADARKGDERGAEIKPSVTLTKEVPLRDVAQSILHGAQLFDASRGMAYRKAHIESAEWVNRANLTKVEDKKSPIIVIGQSTDLVYGVMQRLTELGAEDVAGCVGTPESWRDTGYQVIATPYTPTERECIDFLFFVHDRHDDNLEAARQYLAWELNLLSQLDEQERSVLKPLVASELESMCHEAGN